MVPADTPALLGIAEATRVFKPIEVAALRELLEDFAKNPKDHRAIVDVEGGAVRGFAYYAPASMTDRTWYLYWIAVSPDLQARGVGSAMLRHAEQEIKAAKGRVLFIETSSLETYAKTRRFYQKHSYEQAAVLRDYYAEGDDMVIFRKRLGR
jgi:ribosomal protein S18 acetylase RimI-like enzyme